jgi:hypothetical protein
MASNMQRGAQMKGLGCRCAHVAGSWYHIIGLTWYHGHPCNLLLLKVRVCAHYAWAFAGARGLRVLTLIPHWWFENDRLFENSKFLPLPSGPCFEILGINTGSVCLSACV